MAKKKAVKKAKYSFKNLSKVKRNVIVGIVVIAVVVVLYYLLASEEIFTEEDTYMQSQQDLVENLPQITGQSYFGYLKEDYVLHILVNGNDQRIEITALNEDYTVDIVMNRMFNVEIGETVLADYDYDGAADVSFTLDGVDYYNKRFSATVTYFGDMPEEISTE